MKKTLKDVNLKNKKVLLRADFNVPIENSKVVNDKRIVETLPTINYILEQGGILTIVAHLGRPNGVDKKLSLKPVYQRLCELLPDVKIVFAKDVAGEDSLKKLGKLKSGQILLLENVRFEKGEETNDIELAKKLANFADVYVNDAFGTAHRAHASTQRVATLVKDSCIGFLIEKEISTINKILENPERPFVSIMGGSKMKDKIKVIDSLLNKVDAFIFGGGIAYTFIKALGGNIGESIYDETKLDYCIDVLNKAKKKGVKILLPVDTGCAKEFSAQAKRKNFKSFNVKEGWNGLDIGKKSAKLFAKEIKKAKTVIWNGTVGVAEFENFSLGTKKLAQAVAQVKGTTLIGGGDTATAVIKFVGEDVFSHVSTGGGATLQLLEGKKLPAIEAIADVEKTKKKKIAKKSSKKPTKKVEAKKQTSKVKKDEKTAKVEKMAAKIEQVAKKIEKAPAEKPVAKKPVAKTTAKKPVAKTTAKKSSVTKTKNAVAAKPATAKKPVAQKSAAAKPATKKAPTKKPATTKSATVAKTTAKKSVAKKSTTKTTTVKKPTTKKATTKKTSK